LYNQAIISGDIRIILETINEQIYKEPKETLQERMEASKGKLEPKPKVEKK